MSSKDKLNVPRPEPQAQQAAAQGVTNPFAHGKTVASKPQQPNIQH
jgi:hypothetical protein